MDKALHELHGSKDAQGHFKTDNSTVGDIAAKYVEKIKSGEHKVLGISEIALPGKVFARTFVIQEN